MPTAAPSTASAPALSCSPCGDGLSTALAADDGLRQLWLQLPRRALPAGARLLVAGDPLEHVWYIESGLVRLYCLSADGVERNNSFHAEGAWVGAGVPPQPGTSPYSIETLEPARVVQLSYPELEFCYARLPVVRQLLAEALQRVFARLAARETELLLLDAPSRYLAYQREYAAIAGRIPLRHVAGYLGITDVALSRIRKRLGLTRRAAQPMPLDPAGPA